jgi:hypothetical protein
MSDLSSNLSLPYLAAGQAQKHVTVNESLRRLDAIVQLAVVSATTAAEPGSPADGSVYIVPAGKTGTHWASFTNWALAYWRDGAWEQITAREGMIAWIADADQLVAYDGTLWRGLRGAGRNRLINAGFAINQRGAATNADDTYCFDRWYVLTQTGAIAASALSDPESGRPTGIRLTQSQATAQRIGLAQIVEAANIKDLRAKAVAMAARVRCSASQAIRMAILEWTGTADSVTSDVVNDWTDASFTAGHFFLASNLNVIAVGATTPSAATWTDMTALAGSFGASLNNAIVLVWTEGTLAQNATLDLDQVQLEAGAVCGPFVPPDRADELACCLRYFETVTGIGGVNGVSPFAQRVVTNVIDCFCGFRATKRAIPTLASSAPSFVAAGPGSNNQAAYYDNVAGGFRTATGAVTYSVESPSLAGAILRFTAATSFTGTAGDIGNFYFGSAALFGFDAEL